MDYGGRSCLGRRASKRGSGTLGERIHVSCGGKVPAVEHCGLEPWTMGTEVLHVLAANWLHHIVDVRRDSSSMRPQTDVHLLWTKQLVEHGRSTLDQRTQLQGFSFLQLGDSRDMASGHDDRRPDAEWTDAMLDHAARRSVDDAARQRTPSIGQITSQTPQHVSRSHRASVTRIGQARRRRCAASGATSGAGA
jgi:hypothetical protein